MGNCCHDMRSKLNKTELVIIQDTQENESISFLHEKIYKVFRVNPFYNFGSMRQSLLEKEFLNFQNENFKCFTVLDYFNKYSNNYKILNTFEKILIKFTQIQISILLKEFSNPENLFLNVLMFILSNTKNNIDKKQEILMEIINVSFFVKNNEKKIDLQKMKKYIKFIIEISIIIFINFIILPTYESKENILKIIILENKKTNIHINVANFTIEKIKNEISKKDYNYNKLLQIWEDYLLSPIEFASYSSEKNIANYNLSLKEEILKRIVNIFDNEKIIKSIICFKIE